MMKIEHEFERNESVHVYHIGRRNEKKNHGLEDLFNKYYSRSDDVFKNARILGLKICFLRNFCPIVCNPVARRLSPITTCEGRKRNAPDFRYIPKNS
jgi:hypothetical protein